MKGSGMNLAAIPSSDRPELVEGPYFSSAAAQEEGRCFDKLSTDGFGLALYDLPPPIAKSLSRASISASARSSSSPLAVT
jgi:hypothetical protein